MEIFSIQGYHEFVLATGYRGDQIASYAKGLPREWNVTLVDTGLETGTGSRVERCRDYLSERFMVTYSDGVGDIVLADLLSHHAESGATATLTTVPLPSPYGTVSFDDSGRVSSFEEKPLLRDHWINAGFLVLESEAFHHWSGDDLEREVLPGLAAQGRLFAYRHFGFWSSLDTYKDALRLSLLCDEGTPPWLPVNRSST
jgi:glucose-1-phosphate cytidylyltransferase